MKDNLVQTMLLFGITVILVLSFHVFDSKSSAFAQTPSDPNIGPIPEDNYTDTNTGPIPEDNSTDTNMIPNPIDNSTDMQNLSPVDNNTLPVDNMTMPENNTLPVSIPAPSNSTSIL